MQSNNDEYRKLPAVDRLLNAPTVQLLAAEHSQQYVTDVARKVLHEARRRIGSGQVAPQLDALINQLVNRLTEDAQPSLRSVINATGIIIHTNLGRAPLSQAARQAITEVANGYSNLEYDLGEGKRGSRYVHSRSLLSELTGAEDALVVNNCASALFFVLSAFCQGQDVLISRGELVEIGGGFRIPDVLRQSGAHLVEVGTTNRTHAKDFAQNVSERSAALMRIHSSNFRQIGFVTMPLLDELTEIARSVNQDPTRDLATRPADQPLLVIDDLGSGSLLDTRTYGLAAEPLAQESIAAGADLVVFSGDKLLGGPQAGIIIGRSELIDRLRKHPLHAR